MAHQAGALVYIDAVQYAPHGPIDVQALGCDFLVCSAYKIFGPHIGMLYGRYELLDRLQAFRVRPAPADPPGKFETGTGNFEGYAGWLGALEYLEWLGDAFGESYLEKYGEHFRGRALRLKQAMAAIRAYEYEISRALIEAFTAVPGLQLYGQGDVRGVEGRVPTFAFRLPGYTPREVAERLDAHGIYAWDGNYYALAVTERLELEGRGGMVRVGAVHYNTQEEIEELGAVLQALG
jgi:selenocysteine lyase/cysteine desulfurase